MSLVLSRAGTMSLASDVKEVLTIKIHSIRLICNSLTELPKLNLEMTAVLVISLFAGYLMCPRKG